MPAVSEASAKLRLVFRYTINSLPVSSLAWMNTRALSDVATGRVFFDNGVDSVPLVGYSQLESKVRATIDVIRATQSGGVVSWLGADVYNNELGTDLYIGRVEYNTVGSQPAAEPTRTATFTFADSFGGKYRLQVKGFSKAHTVYRQYPTSDTAINAVFDAFHLDEEFCTRYDDSITRRLGITVTTSDKLEKMLGYRR